LKQVLHIFRKLLPHTATFIRNQLVYHERYHPFVIHAETIPGIMETELRSKMECYQVIDDPASAFLYKRFRMLAPSGRKKVRELIRKIKPDIIHVHYGVDFLPFSNVLARCKIPVVVSFYGYDCTSFPKRFMGLGKYWLQQKTFSNPSLAAVFAMSPDMKQDLIHLGCKEELIKLHYYGSECLKFSSERTYPEKEKIEFCIISGFAQKKGHFFLLDSWKMMNNFTSKNRHLSIYGSGELKEEISSYILKSGIENVTLMGPLAYGSPEHLDVLKQADIFVHPSITTSDGDKEGIPGALIEAMASGLAVISTRHAGIPAVIEHNQTGLLVDEHNTEQLAKSMASLCNNHKLRELLGRNAQQFATSSLDITAKEKELEALYDEVLHHTSKPSMLN
jgi:colanic acid/amylovoran biosynthesis glycosyltransferase